MHSLAQAAPKLVNLSITHAIPAQYSQGNHQRVPLSLCPALPELGDTLRTPLLAQLRCLELNDIILKPEHFEGVILDDLRSFSTTSSAKNGVSDKDAVNALKQQQSHPELLEVTEYEIVPEARDNSATTRIILSHVEAQSQANADEVPQALARAQTQSEVQPPTQTHDGEQAFLELREMLHVEAQSQAQDRTPQALAQSQTQLEVQGPPQTRVGREQELRELRELQQQEAARTIRILPEEKSRQIRQGINEVTNNASAPGQNQQALQRLKDVSGKENSEQIIAQVTVKQQTAAQHSVAAPGQQPSCVGTTQDQQVEYKAEWLLRTMPPAFQQVSHFECW